MGAKNLTSEDVVSGLISQNGILSPISKELYITKPKRNLGDFLAEIETSTKLAEKKSRYSFIQEGLWKV